MKKFALSLAFIPISLFADGGLPTQPYIYVRGDADTEKPPDTVIMRFDLVARAPDQSKANSDLQARAAKVFALLDQRKIARTDVVAQQVRSEADFEQSEGYGYPRNRGKLIGYVVTRQFAVKVRDVTAFPKLVDDLIAAANVEFTGIEGSFSKGEDVSNELWDKALADARKQAEKTVKQMGMKIDSVFAISPVPIPEIQSTMFPKSPIEQVIVTGSNIPTKEGQVAPEYRPCSLTLKTLDQKVIPERDAVLLSLALNKMATTIIEKYGPLAADEPPIADWKVVAGIAGSGKFSIQFIESDVSRSPRSQPPSNELLLMLSAYLTLAFAIAIGLFLHSFLAGIGAFVICYLVVGFAAYKLREWWTKRG